LSEANDTAIGEAHEQQGAFFERNAVFLSTAERQRQKRRGTGARGQFQTNQVMDKKSTR